MVKLIRWGVNCRTGWIITLAMLAATAQAGQRTISDTAGGPLQKPASAEMLRYTISIEGDHLTWQDIKDSIERLAGYGVLIDNSLLTSGETFNLHYQNVTVGTLLEIVTRGKDVRVDVEGSGISIKRYFTKPRRIKVSVRNKEGRGVQDVTIYLGGRPAGTTGEKGDTVISVPKGYDSMVVSYMKRQQTIAIPAIDSIVVQMEQWSSLPQAKVSHPPTAKTTKTGNALKENTSVGVSYSGTAQSALSGQTAGALTIQKSGIHGADMSIIIRGRNALQGDTPPLCIVDGTPFIIRSAGNIVDGNPAGLSPFSFLAGAVIRKMNILKDADSLAPYGTRGVNGIIIIETRRIRDSSRLSIDVNTGLSMPTRSIRLMNTRQYVMMRREAFRNDSLTPDENNAPDLKSWDTTSNTDWNKTIFNRAAKFAEVAISGGLSGRRFSCNTIAYYRQEEEILGNHPKNYLTTLYGSASYVPNDRLEVHITVIYSNNHNNQYSLDETSLQFYVPNIPSLVDSAHRLVFTINGVPVNNPLAFNQYQYGAYTQTVVGNFALTYERGGWEFRLNGGYNGIDTREGTFIPALAQNPLSDPTDLRYRARTNMGGWIMESQLSYRWGWGNWNLSTTAGVSWYLQHDRIDAPTDTVSLTGLSTSSGYTVTDYRNAGVHIQLDANLQQRLFLDLTARRDASSRIAAGHTGFTSMAAGASWIFFQKQSAVKEKNFMGRLHFTYGIAGSDAVGDYGYLVRWSSIPGNVPPQLAGGYYPSAPANPSLTWQPVQKMSLGTAWSLYGDRLSLGVVYYSNRISDLLVPYSLPLTTGYSTEMRNWPAVIRNYGWEVSIQKRPREKRSWEKHPVKWTSSLTFTLPRDKLVSFRDIDNSYYGSTLTVGQPVEAVKLYQYTGVNSLTGLFTFNDFNGDGQYTDADKKAIGKPVIRMYGGWSNSVQVGQWQLDIALEGMIQTGYDYLRDIYNINPPGSLGPGLFSNEPVAVLDRWQKPGDRAHFQKFTTLQQDSEAGKLIPIFTNSTGILHDASFLRLRQLTLTYKLPAGQLKKIKTESEVYLQAQNVLTLTPYPDVDPMIQSGLICPLVKSFSIGFRMHII